MKTKRLGPYWKYAETRTKMSQDPNLRNLWDPRITIFTNCYIKKVNFDGGQMIFKYNFRFPVLGSAVLLRVRSETIQQVLFTGPYEESRNHNKGYNLLFLEIIMHFVLLEISQEYIRTIWCHQCPHCCTSQSSIVSITKK